jgi:hypothetical protein
MTLMLDKTHAALIAADKAQEAAIELANIEVQLAALRQGMLRGPMLSGAYAIAVPILWLLLRLVWKLYV